MLVRADETERRIGAGYTPELLAAWGVESFLSIRTTDAGDERATVFRVPASLLGLEPLDGQGETNGAGKAMLYPIRPNRRAATTYASA